MHSITQLIRGSLQIQDDVCASIDVLYVSFIQPRHIILYIKAVWLA
jgi:hypothetical protein